MTSHNRELLNHAQDVEKEILGTVEVVHDVDVHKKAKSRLATPPALIAWVLWASLGGWTYGFTASIISSSLAQPSFAAYFGFATDPALLTHIQAYVVMYFVGSLFGLFTNAYTSDKFGRVNGARINCVINMIGTAISGGSTNNWYMGYIGRFLTGWGGWGAAGSGILYQAEVSVAETRGWLTGFAGWTYSASFCLTAWMGLGFYYYNSENAWRVALLVGLWAPFFMLVFSFFVPDTPRWYADQGRFEDCFNVLKRLHKNKADPNHLYAKEEFDAMVKQSELDRELPHSWMAIFKTKSLRKRFYVSALCGSLITLNGIQAIVAYQATLYALFGYSPLQQLFLAAGWITIAPIFDIGTMYFSDAWGRKQLVIFGAIGTALVLSIFAGLVANFGPGGAHTDNKAGQHAAVAFIFVFLAVFMSMQASGLTYCIEVWPTHLRAKGTLVGLGFLNLMNLWTVGATPTGLAEAGWKFLLAFILPSFFGAILFWYIAPDTNQMTLERMCEIFGDENQFGAVSGALNVSSDALNKRPSAVSSIGVHEKGHHQEQEGLNGY